MKKLPHAVLRRNARFCAWRSYGVPVEGEWLREEDFLNVVVWCLECEAAQNDILSGTEELLGHPREKDLVYLESHSISCLPYSCRHARPLLGQDPPGVREATEKAFLALTAEPGDQRVLAQSPEAIPAELLALAKEHPDEVLESPILNLLSLEDPILYAEVAAKARIERAERRILEGITYLETKELVLFAADCAERALPVYESHFPQNPRPRQALETARRAARGQVEPLALLAAQKEAEALRGLASQWTKPFLAARAATFVAQLATKGTEELKHNLQDVLNDTASAVAGGRFNGTKFMLEREWQAERLQNRIRERHRGEDLYTDRVQDPQEG